MKGDIMSFREVLKFRAERKVAVAAITLALATAPLLACGGQQAANGGPSAASTSQVVVVDPSSWKTLGDALSGQTNSYGAGWNEDRYVTVIQIGDSYYRLAAKMNADASKKLDEIDWSDSDAAEKETQKAIAGLVLVSAEDVTGDYLSQDELDALVGKTGQELVDEGFAFQDYFMYGGEQTGANFTKGSLAYMFTFNASTDEKDTSDEGRSVMNAKVTAAEFVGAADAATDPS